MSPESSHEVHGVMTMAFHNTETSHLGANAWRGWLRAWVAGRGNGPHKINHNNALPIYPPNAPLTPLTHLPTEPTTSLASYYPGNASPTHRLANCLTKHRQYCFLSIPSQFAVDSVLHLIHRYKRKSSRENSAGGWLSDKQQDTVPQGRGGGLWTH